VLTGGKPNGGPMIVGKALDGRGRAGTIIRTKTRLAVQKLRKGFSIWPTYRENAFAAK